MRQSMNDKYCIDVSISGFEITSPVSKREVQCSNPTYPIMSERCNVYYTFRTRTTVGKSRGVTPGLFNLIKQHLANICKHFLIVTKFLYILTCHKVLGTALGISTGLGF